MEKLNYEFDKSKDLVVWSFKKICKPLKIKNLKEMNSMFRFLELQMMPDMLNKLEGLADEIVTGLIEQRGLIKDKVKAFEKSVGNNYQQ